MRIFPGLSFPTLSAKIINKIIQKIIPQVFLPVGYYLPSFCKYDNAVIGKFIVEFVLDYVSQY
ncbi:MAG: hypothetical protein JST55_00420 [Bacteroidetes bacterium]|nr:hypothetical protein [Bacteroidota bacterium]